MACIYAIFQYQFLVRTIFFQLCIQKKLHGMTKLLYKMKMIMKIRFINIMKDAELGSAEDLIRIPPLDMKLGGTRLITPL